MDEEYREIYHLGECAHCRYMRYVHSQLFNKLDNLEKKVDKLMATIADLDTALAASDTDVQALTVANQSLLTYLQSLPQTPDVTAQVTHVQNINTLLAALTATDVAAVPVTTPPPATTPTT